MLNSPARLVGAHPQPPMTLPQAAARRQLKHRRQTDVQVSARGHGLWAGDAWPTDVKTRAGWLAPNTAATAAMSCACTTAPASCRRGHHPFRLSERPRSPDEDPRIPGQGTAAPAWRAGAARLPRLHRARSAGGGAEARRQRLGRQGADPRRRPRQGRRRQARALARRGRAAGRPDPGHAAQDAPDRPRRPEGAPPADRGRRRHQEGVLRRRADRPRHAEGGHDGQLRGRHGHRGSGAQDAREDHQGLRRPAGGPDRRAGAGARTRHRRARGHRRRRPSTCSRSSTPATWTPTPRWPRSTR